MPDFAALQDMNVLPKEVDFSGASNPGAFGPMDEEIPSMGISAPSLGSLKRAGMAMMPGVDGIPTLSMPNGANFPLPNLDRFGGGMPELPTNEEDLKAFAEQASQLGSALPSDFSNFSPSDLAGMAGPLAGMVGGPEVQAAVQNGMSIAQNLMSMANGGLNMASMGGLMSTLGGMMGCPEIGEAIQKLEQGEQALKSLEGMMGEGGIEGLLSNPASIIDGLQNLMGMLGIQLPPLVQAALAQAKAIMAAIAEAVPPGGSPGVFVGPLHVARVGTSMTMHGLPLIPGPGALTVLCMGTPVWRAGLDTNICAMPPTPATPHGPGKSVPSQTFVLANMGPVALHTDMIIEVPPNAIAPFIPGTPSTDAKKPDKPDKEKPPPDEKPVADDGDKGGSGGGSGSGSSGDGGDDKGDVPEDGDEQKISDPKPADPSSPGLPVDIHPGPIDPSLASLPPELQFALNGKSPEEQQQMIDQYNQFKQEYQAYASNLGKDPLTAYRDSLDPEQQKIFDETVKGFVTATVGGILTGGAADELALGGLAGALKNAAVEQQIQSLIKQYPPDMQASIEEQMKKGFDLADLASSFGSKVNADGLTKKAVEDQLIEKGVDKAFDGTTGEPPPAPSPAEVAAAEDQEYQLDHKHDPGQSTTDPNTGKTTQY